MSQRSRTDPSPQHAANRRAFVASGAVMALALLAAPIVACRAAQVAVNVPAPAPGLVTEASGPREVAVFAGGCFWGVQGVFQHTRGVLQAVSGYTGGSKAAASYPIVGSGLSGHAESVQVTFDPKQISYAQLLQIFFSVVHDPTQLNRQGPDVGTQYRSAIFATSAAQQRVAEAYVAQLDAAKVFASKIVTQIGPLAAFYPAEDEHQDYATLHPESRYIAHFDLPKIAALKKMFPERYREQPVLVMARRG